MVGDSREGKGLPEDVPGGTTEPEGGGTPVFGGVSEAELDVFVSKLRTDKNPRVPAATSRARGDVHGERLHKGVRRSLVSSVAEEEPAPTPVPTEKHAWFIVLGAKPVGPFDAEALKAPWERGELGPDSLCWRVGFEAWLPLGQVPELIQSLSPLPLALELSAAVDEALSAAFAEGPQLPAAMTATVAESSGIPSWAVEASPRTASSAPVDSVGTHAVLKDVTEVSEQVEARTRVGGWWFTLAGGVAGGVTVALVMGLFGRWDGASALLARMNVAELFKPAPTEVVAPPVVAAAPPAVSAPPAEAVVATPVSAEAVSPAPVGGAVAPVAVTAAPLLPTPPQVAQARPSLAGVAAVERGGAVPVLAVAGGGLATSVRASASSSNLNQDVEAAPGVGAVSPRVPEVKLASGARPVAPPPVPVVEPVRAAPAPAGSDDDLGLDEDFARELAGPAPGSGARDEAKSVYIPPVAPIQNPRVSLAQSDVFEVVLANKGEVTACADVKPRPVDTGTRVVVRWSILPSGEVSEVVTETGSLRGTSFARCIEAKVGAWIFPKHQEQGGPVRFPFVF
ncbi:GYF domain-containing protein [Corallococcus terminator]